MRALWSMTVDVPEPEMKSESADKSPETSSSPEKVEVPDPDTVISSSKIASPESTLSPWVRMRSVADIPPAKVEVPVPDKVEVEEPSPRLKSLP